MTYFLVTLVFLIGFTLGLVVRAMWHPGLPSDPFYTSGIWLCSGCGEMMPMSGVIQFATWRWNGKVWEHQCGHAQTGYQPCRYFREVDTPKNTNNYR
jgi:hypothetical protein